MPSPSIVPCRWNWCRSSFTSIDALAAHVKHDHIWPMKPMRKADIVLMRRMDFQSLHSSANTESSSIPRGLIGAVSRGKTPTSTPETPRRRDAEFDTFAELSSPLPAHSPERLPVSPAFESLTSQNGRSGLSAAVDIGRKADRHLPNLPPRPCSSTDRPSSRSSGFSQEVVEQQLTQEDDLGPQQLLHPVQQIDDGFTGAEFRWSTDDELPTNEETQSSEQPVSEQNDHRSSFSDPARGQSFRTGSLNVLLHINSPSATTSINSQSPPISQRPYVLQSQAPYSSQATGWSDA